MIYFLGTIPHCADYNLDCLHKMLAPHMSFHVWANVHLDSTSWPSALINDPYMFSLEEKKKEKDTWVLGISMKFLHSFMINIRVGNIMNFEVLFLCNYEFWQCLSKLDLIRFEYSCNIWSLHVQSRREKERKRHMSSRHINEVPLFIYDKH